MIAATPAEWGFGLCFAAAVTLGILPKVYRGKFGQFASEGCVVAAMACGLGAIIFFGMVVQEM